MRRISIFLLGLFLPFFAFADELSNLHIFNPSAIANGTDLSIQYLGDIYGVVDGVLHGSGSQVMGQMFMVFNAGALLLGGIIVIYTGMISLLNTANEGEMLGKKWNSIWIPLRTVVGIALLIPKATGYCAIQIFMMWVIVQGVGLADTVWNQVTNYLAAGGVLVQQSFSPDDNIGNSAKNMMRQTVCLAGLQTAFNKAYSNASNAKGSTGATLPAVPNFLGSMSPLKPDPNPCTGSMCSAPLPNFTTEDNVGATWTNLNGVCGTVSWNQMSSQATKNAEAAGNNSELREAYEESIRIGVQQILMDLSGPSQTVVNNTIYPPSGTTGSTDVTDYVSKLLFTNAAEDYEGIVYPAQHEWASKLQIEAGNAWISKANKQGWIEAGSYYQFMASKNSEAGAAVFTAPSGTKLSALIGDAHMGRLSDSGTIPSALYPFVIPYLAALTNQISESSSSLNTFINNASAGDAASKNQRHGSAQRWSLFGGGVGGLLVKLIMPLFTPLINIIEAFAGLMGAQSTNANPVVMIALMGDGLIGLVLEIWIVGAMSLAGATAVIGMFPCNDEATTMTVLTNWVIPFVWGICGLLFVEGAVMAFYIPMIPFILFLFGAIGWIIATIEAMVAAPLVALGITHPEGAEVMGKSDPAVLLLVNVFMRPSMMIIGFIAGVILSYVSIWILNVGFLENALAGAYSAVSNLAHVSVIAVIFSIPALLIVYVTMVISLLNYSFSLINVVPDKVMRWIGGQVEGVAGEAGRMSGEAKSGLQSAAKGGGEAMKDMAQKAGQKEDKAGTTKAKIGGGSDGGDSSSSKKGGS